MPPGSRFLFEWREAVCDSSLAASVRLVALVISMHMRNDGTGAFPGANRLARKTGLHVTTVRLARETLVTEGYLALVERGGAHLGGQRRANEYRATIPTAPVGQADPSDEPTGSSVLPDPSDEPSRPVGPPDPISVSNSAKNSRGEKNQPKPKCVRCQGRGTLPRRSPDPKVGLVDGPCSCTLPPLKLEATA